MMRNKLGIKGEVDEDSLLIKELLTWMESYKADYTNTFRSIMNERFDDSLYKDQKFKDWYKKLQKRKPNKGLMKQNNPLVIPRNHKVEEVLKAAEQGNYDPLTAILSVLKNPYTEDKKIEPFQNPAPESATAYQTFCGT